MEHIYLIFVVALLLLAVVDLIVGVGNDAVNFLNSAIGARVASFYFILAVASLGVLLGATFSSGMMEIARSGIFNPDQFFFAEVMIIFLAVMITDMVLLDVFNTFGLPTSTTVSIVFEILGAAVAVALIKISNGTDNMLGIGNYINSARALTIISGILLSVVIAFTVGMLIQFVTRVLFTFDYEKKIPYLGAIWGSISVTAIVYFLLVKGARGASFMTPEVIHWINKNTMILLLSCLAGFGLLFQFLIMVFKTNILRIIVLIGTFSLAMAFAGNDLVNFIGVPLAGLESFRTFLANPGINPETYTMESLLEPVQTPTIFLLIAGVIMVLALVFSKKARSVTKTEVDLARQSDGDERFASSLLARNLVRMGMEFNRLLCKIIPPPLLRFIEKRLDLSISQRPVRGSSEAASFDQLRASVNLFVASILIALATSLKLPLSTTYVTFMVAMGTSLSDRAWGRESAVYRVTGVITVIGGWFFTAFAAFSAAFLIALFISWGGLIAALIAIALAFLMIGRTYFIHKRRVTDETNRSLRAKTDWNGQNVMNECKNNIIVTLQEASRQYVGILRHLMAEDRKKMRKTLKKVDELNIKTKELKREAYITLKKLEEDAVDSGHYYIQILDYLREISHCLNFISESSYEYLDNNHPALHPAQKAELTELITQFNALFALIDKVLKENTFADLEQVNTRQKAMLDAIHKMKKRQIRLIKAEQVGTRNSMLYFNILGESKNLLLYTINMLKSHRDFVLYRTLPME